MSDAQYTDGRAGLSELILTNLSNGYTYFGEDFKTSDGADVKIFKDSNGVHIGSDVKKDVFTGSASLTYASLDYSLPTDAHRVGSGQVLNIDGYYFVVGKAETSKAPRDVSKVSVDLTEIVNPIVSSALSSTGNSKTFSKTVGSAYTKNHTAVNTRVGSTVTWRLAATKTGLTIPAGLAIASATGIETWATPAAGTYKYEVICTDTLAGDVREGYSTVTLVVT